MITILKADTSAAALIVAGLAAGLYAHRPDASPADVRDALRRGTRPFDDRPPDRFGTGVVDFDRTLDSLLE